MNYKINTVSLLFIKGEKEKGKVNFFYNGRGGVKVDSFICFVLRLSLDAIQVVNEKKIHESFLVKVCLNWSMYLWIIQNMYNFSLFKKMERQASIL